MSATNGPLIVIVGRSNVGKSTFFNRIANQNIAIITSQLNTTRDRNRFRLVWKGTPIFLEDTGGYEPHEDDLSTLVREKIVDAIKDADALLFFVDVSAGTTGQDREIASLIRKLAPHTPVFLVANKADLAKNDLEAFDLYKLGFGDPHFISAFTGRNVKLFMDQVVMSTSAAAGSSGIRAESPGGAALRLAVVGRPNVGKSSLVNSLIDKKSMIVSEVPGTTRDSVDLHLSYKGDDFIITDTMGLRKRKKITHVIDHLGTARALNSIESADAVLFLIDALEGIAEQEKKIAGFIEQEGKCVVLVVNKWDLTDQKHTTALEYTDAIRKLLGFIDYAPISFISAAQGKGVMPLLDSVKKCVIETSKRVDPAELSLFLKEIMNTQHFSYKGKRIRVFSLEQVGIKPPSFILRVSNSDIFHFSNKRFFENKIREKFGFSGTPIKIMVKTKVQKGFR